MPYNLNIPGWMPEAELKTIEMLAQTIPRDGNMVEIGPFCGRSSWCWARSADPSVTVHCLDIWNPAEHPYHPPATIGNDQTTNADFGAAMDREKVSGTLENFKYFTGDCANVVAHQGASPRDFKNWDEPLDLVFLDGVHHNPIFWQDLNFWFWKLKPGGLCCGDDFARTHPDVVWGVQDFAKTHGLTFLVQGRIWMMPRPPHRPIPTTLFGNREASVPDAGTQQNAGFRRRKLRRECSTVLCNTLNSRTGRYGPR
jgi:Methyltransferase domain